MYVSVNGARMYGGPYLYKLKATANTVEKYVNVCGPCTPSLIRANVGELGGLGAHKMN